MARELILDHQEISNPQTITKVMEDRFKDEGLNIHTHEVTKIEDDFRQKRRRVMIKNTKFFTVGDIPWKR